jgi:3-hydroxymyristoyl/3-hydroxydecanoyl-(acyl carrier protein) dehydratase
MPGVLLIEAMAQVGGVILLSTYGNAGKLVYLVGLDRVRFRKPVIPGDSVITEVEHMGQRGNFGKVKAVARVDGEIVAECVILYSVVDSPVGSSGGEGRAQRGVPSPSLERQPNVHAGTPDSSR